MNLSPTLRKRLYQLPAAVWAIMIFILLTLPGSKVPHIYFWTFGIEFDKFIHGVLFFAQAMFLWMAFLTTTRDTLFSRRPVLIAAILSSLYGGLMELYQSTLADRSADFMDFLADSAGAAAFILLVSLNLLRPVVKRLRGM